MRGELRTGTNIKKPRMGQKRLLSGFNIIRRDILTILGVALLLVFIFLAIFGPYIVPHDPLEVNLRERLQGVSLRNPMGTDFYGRDIFSRVVVATRVDLLIAFSAASIAFILGTTIGVVGGYYGGLIDEIFMRIMDIIQAFPPLVLAMALALALGPGMSNLIFVISFILIPTFARLIRSEMLSVKKSEFAEAARCSGASDFRIIFLHLLPNCFVPVLVQFGLSISYGILDAAGLSFLGLGIRPPTPEWGLMIKDGLQFVTTGEWWTFLFPGLVLFLVVMGTNLTADGIRDILDPKSRNQSRF